MSNFERDMANTMLDAADARIASLEADKADLLRVLGVADEKIRSGEDARGQYIRENAALEARCRELEAALRKAIQFIPGEPDGGKGSDFYRHCVALTALETACKHETHSGGVKS